MYETFLFVRLKIKRQYIYSTSSKTLSIAAIIVRRTTAREDNMWLYLLLLLLLIIDDIASRPT